MEVQVIAGKPNGETDHRSCKRRWIVYDRVTKLNKTRH
jgi:hypothetical protein